MRFLSVVESSVFLWYQQCACILHQLNRSRSPAWHQPFRLVLLQTYQFPNYLYGKQYLNQTWLNHVQQDQDLARLHVLPNLVDLILLFGDHGYGKQQSVATRQFDVVHVQNSLNLEQWLERDLNYDLIKGIAHVHCCVVDHPSGIYRNIHANQHRLIPVTSNNARKVLQYTLHYQRKVQCQDAVRQQLLAFVDPFPIAKTFSRMLFKQNP